MTKEEMQQELMKKMDAFLRKKYMGQEAPPPCPMQVAGYIYGDGFTDGVAFMVEHFENQIKR